MSRFWTPCKSLLRAGLTDNRKIGRFLIDGPPIRKFLLTILADEAGGYFN
nr:MAG TPA: hypothetical protein [Caudoviricetes sp.]